MPIRERISGVDTAWLRMEHPTNLMMIVGVLMFDDKVSFAQLRKTIESHWLAFPRFKQKAIQDPTGVWWETDDDFDIKNHLHKVRLPGKAGKKELENLVSKLSSEGLDFSRPRVNGTTQNVQKLSQPFVILTKVETPGFRTKVSTW